MQRHVAVIIAIGLVAMPCVGVAKDKSIPSGIKGDPGIWFPQNSYPADAKRKGEQGRVTVELAIDKTGTPVACNVVFSSGSASLDSITCKLALANARFIPAKDAKGQSIASRYTLPAVRWELKDDVTNLYLDGGPVTSTNAVEITVDAQGKGVACQPIADTSGAKFGCENFRPGSTVSPPLRLGDKPVAGKVTITTTTRVEAK